jgi:hypothetical protein
MFTQALKLEPHLNHIMNQPFQVNLNLINLKNIYICYSKKVEFKIAFLHVFSYFWGKGLKGSNRRALPLGGIS